jgi:hypothetical protein
MPKETLRKVAVALAASDNFASDNGKRIIAAEKV